VIRDFDVIPMRDLSGWNGQGYPPNGPAIPDPELMQATVTVTNPGMPAGPIQVFVIYSDFYGSVPGGLIRLWRDQTKENAIPLWDVGNGVYQGSLPTFPTCTFYIEGIRPSRQGGNDVMLKVKYQGMPGPGQQDPPPPAEDQKSLTVTPVVQEFSVNPKDPDNTSWLKNENGVIFGISSGEQADGELQGSTKPGVKYTADLNVKGIGGKGMFLQNVTMLSHANPAVELTNGNKYNPYFQNQGFPLLDAPEGDIFYPTQNGVVYDSNRQMIWSVDTPGLGHIGFAGNLSSMDATFQARMYLVWEFPDPDLTIYTLAWADWQVVFQASTGAGGLQLSPNSVVSAEPKLLSNWDPATISPPPYNRLVQSPFFWELA
jgi:hypothetical protein